MTTSREAAAGALRQAIAEILPETPQEQIVDDKQLKDLGADSVDRVEIIVRASGLLGIDQPLSAFGGLPDIGALVDRLASCARSA
jgi:polyketide biosynthesis acyl carrier protein